MRKHGGTPSQQEEHVTLAAISPPGVARGRFVGGHQSGLAGSKPPPRSTRGPLPVCHRGNARGNHGAPLHDRVRLPTYSFSDRPVRGELGMCCALIRHLCIFGPMYAVKTWIPPPFYAPYGTDLLPPSCCNSSTVTQCK